MDNKKCTNCGSLDIKMSPNNEITCFACFGIFLSDKKEEEKTTYLKGNLYESRSRRLKTIPRRDNKFIRGLF